MAYLNSTYIKSATYITPSNFFIAAKIGNDNDGLKLYNPGKEDEATIIGITHWQLPFMTDSYSNSSTTYAIGGYNIYFNANNFISSNGKLYVKGGQAINESSARYFSPGYPSCKIISAALTTSNTGKRYLLCTRNTTISGYMSTYMLPQIYYGNGTSKLYANDRPFPVAKDFTIHPVNLFYSLLSTSTSANIYLNRVTASTYSSKGILISYLSANATSFDAKKSWYVSQSNTIWNVTTSTLLSGTSTLMFSVPGFLTLIGRYYGADESTTGGPGLYVTRSTYSTLTFHGSPSIDCCIGRVEGESGSRILTQTLCLTVPIQAGKSYYVYGRKISHIGINFVPIGVNLVSNQSFYCY